MDTRTSPDLGAVDRLPLGAFALDLVQGELLDANGRPAPLRRQALAVLRVLGERAGQVVGKDDLMRLVWPDVVVGEGSLAAAVADIRRVRGDDDASRARVNRLAQLMHLCRRAANGAAIDLSTITSEQGDFTEDAPAPEPDAAGSGEPAPSEG